MTKVFTFSGGEVHVKRENATSKSAYNLIMTDYTMNGFMALCLENEVLRRTGATSVTVTIPYLPYARQDRVMESDEPFSLKVFCDMLNAQKFDRVTIFDPHSDVGPALINNCAVIPQWWLASRALPSAFLGDGETIFVSPDAGAYKKVSKLITDDSRIAIGVKHRNATGEISHTDVLSPTDLTGKHCVMVDDICDGGRTFTALASALKAKGAAYVSLYVTHGIFSQGLAPLLVDIDDIFTTNTFPQTKHDRLLVCPVI